MKIRRIGGILWQEIFILRRSYEVIADIIVFPFTNILVFGFISLYLSSQNPVAAEHVLSGMLLWGVIWIVQYSVTLGSLWNIWSRNLSNLFISPLRLDEYVFAQTLSGVIKAFIVLVINSVLCSYVFGFNILDMGLLSLVISFINLSLFAYALGIILLGLILKFGVRIQAVAWSLVGLIQPLVAAFYPLAVMPTWLQYCALAFSPTYVFEATRYSLEHHAIAWNLYGTSFALNVICCIICTMLFQRMYDDSRDTGQFARNES